MNKLVFALICGCIMCAATMTVRAQSSHTSDSVFVQIALNNKEDAEIRRFALTRITDQSAIGQIVLNEKEDADFRKFALTRTSDQSVIRQIALNDKEDAEIRKFALTRIR
jgi:hypothetical protein